MASCPKCHALLMHPDHCTECDWIREIVVQDSTNLSDAERSLDLLVQDASVPSLATLFKAGQKAGYIRPIQGYGS